MSALSELMVSCSSVCFLCSPFMFIWSILSLFGCGWADLFGALCGVDFRLVGVTVVGASWEVDVL